MTAKRIFYNFFIFHFPFLPHFSHCNIEGLFFVFLAGPPPRLVSEDAGGRLFSRQGITETAENELDG